MPHAEYLLSRGDRIPCRSARGKLCKNADRDLFEPRPAYAKKTVAAVTDLRSVDQLSVYTKVRINMRLL